MTILTLWRQVPRILLCIFLITSCTKEKLEFSQSETADDYFHVKNGDYPIPVWVRGNTLSKKIILFVQGGPASNSMDFAFVDYPNWKNTLEKEYAIAYYEQRGTGNRQGNFELGDPVLDAYVDDLHVVAAFLKKAYDAEVILMGHSFGGSLVYRYMIEHNADGIPVKYIALNGPVTTDISSLEQRWQFRHAFLYNVAQLEIDRGHNEAKWNDALNWLAANPVIKKLDGDDPYALMHQWNKYVEELVYAYYHERDIALRTYLQIFRMPYNPFPAFLGDDDDLGGLINADEEQYQLITKLNQIDHQPLLLVTGRYDDICVAEELQYAFDQITSPLKQLEIIDYAGHEIFTHQPEKLNQLIQNFIQ